MADFAKTLAVAREALGAIAPDNDCPMTPAEIALRDLLAALDAQQPLAWMTAGGDVSRSKLWCDERSLGSEPSPLYAAPPAGDEVTDDYARAFRDGWLACKRGDAEPPAPTAAQREQTAREWVEERFRKGQEAYKAEQSQQAAPTAPAVPDADGLRAAIDSASELATNAPDERYRRRAEQVLRFLRGLLSPIDPQTQAKIDAYERLMHATPEDLVKHRKIGSAGVSND